MKCIYEQPMKVLSSWTDINMELGLAQALSVVQDNMCEYFRELKCDGPTMVPVCNCFLVVTKTKIKFNNYLKWLDSFKVVSEISSKTRIKINLNTEILDESGGVAVSCLQEMCAMDSNLRKLRMLDTTLVPSDLEVTKVSDIVFSKFDIEVEEKDLVKTCNVNVCNLDFYKHTNNVEYVRLMLSTLDLDFVSNNKINDFEIHYITESRYGNELKIYRKEINDGLYFEIRKEDNPIIKAFLNYKQNK